MIAWLNQLQNPNGPFQDQISFKLTGSIFNVCPCNANDVSRSKSMSVENKRLHSLAMIPRHMQIGLPKLKINMVEVPA